MKFPRVDFFGPFDIDYEGLSEPEFYGDLVYKFKKLKEINDFSFQFRKSQVLAFSKSLRAFSPSYRMKADPIQHMCFNSWFLVCRKKWIVKY